MSYGNGKLFNVLMEELPDGQKQGGITDLDIKSMPTGISRGRFHPGDGQFYICGLFVWCSQVTQAGGFYRIRYTGKPLYIPNELHVASDGVVITFTDELDRALAEDTGNYSAEMWNLLRRADYGSQDFKVTQRGQQGRDQLEVKTVTLSADGKTLYLEVPGIRPVDEFEVDMNIKAADGKRMRTYVQSTIHALGKRPIRALLNSPAATE